MTAIALKNISKAFDSHQVLQNLSLEIASGEFFFLVGPSGCGKTTLLRIISGLEKADSGEVFFDDQNVTNTPVQQRRIGFVFQNYSLWPHMTLAQNILFGLEVQGKNHDEQQKTLKETLELVQLTGLENRFPHELSGGQQQRVALGRALALKPKLLLLDEPLSNLDATLKESIRKELKSLQQTLGITTVAVSHDQEDAMYLASRVGIMDKGVLTKTGTPQEIWAR